MRKAARSATRLGKIGAAFALALFCGSCTRGFEIKPAGLGTDVQLKFYNPGLLWDSPTEECISKLTVREEQWPHRQPSRVIWQIATKAGCMTLGSVEIGKVPAGFAEVVNHLPLRIGEMYGAEARADLWFGASLPWFVCSEAPAAIGWKDDYRLKEPPSRCSG